MGSLDLWFEGIFIFACYGLLHFCLVCFRRRKNNREEDENKKYQ